MLPLFSHVGNVRGRPVVYKRRGAPRSPPAGQFVCRSLDWYPFDHSAPDLSTRIRCRGLRHESDLPGDIEMDKLLRNQGANILGYKLRVTRLKFLSEQKLGVRVNFRFNQVSS